LREKLPGAIVHLVRLPPNSLLYTAI